MMDLECINFFEEDINLPILNIEKVKTWLIDIAKNNSNVIEEINYIFCSDEYLLKVNIEYLDHDYYTDIITFDNSEIDDVIEGDIFISLDRIKDNSKSLNESFDNELLRVLAHGLLHLIGFNDKTNEDQEEMTKQENLALELYLSI